MPAIGAHDALPRAKRMRDDRDVGLRSAYDVVHRGIGARSRLLDERASTLAPFVELVARIRFRIRRLQCLENFGDRAMAVVVIQSNHEYSSFLQTPPSYKKAALAGNPARHLASTAPLSIPDRPLASRLPLEQRSDKVSRFFRSDLARRFHGLARGIKHASSCFGRPVFQGTRHGVDHGRT